MKIFHTFVSVQTKLHKKMEQTVIYNQFENESDYYVDGNCVASVNHNSDEFTAHEEMSETDKDFYYSEMIKDKEGFEQFKTYEDA